MSECWLYDGSFEGLLCALADMYTESVRPLELIPERAFMPRLFDTPRLIRTDAEKAEKLEEVITRKLGERPLRRAVYAHLSRVNRIEEAIISYLMLGLSVGPSVDARLTDDAVATVLKISRQVSGEAHRLSGLIRFSRLSDGLLFAPFGPVYPVLPLLSFHFSRRLPSDRWILWDERHRQGCFHEHGDLHDIELSAQAVQRLSSGGRVDGGSDDDRWEKLWKQYFKDIAIKERKNPKLQQHFMPKRYWRYLVEKKEEE